MVEKEDNAGLYSNALAFANAAFASANAAFALANAFDSPVATAFALAFIRICICTCI